MVIRCNIIHYIELDTRTDLVNIYEHMLLAQNFVEISSTFHQLLPSLSIFQPGHHPT